jgi:hypothetical protein
LDIYYILFLKYFQYSYAGGEFIHVYTRLFFGRVAYTRYDVTLFVDWADFRMY